MNSVLNRILETGTVSDGANTISLRHPEFPDRNSQVSPETGALLQRAILDVQPHASLEVGFAYGVSTLFICEALTKLPHPVTHVVMDPFQNGKWRGIGLRNIREAGFGSMVEFVEDRSELALPRLLSEERRVDFAFIDGLHRFEQVMVEFYYVNRLLRPGGVVLFDNANRRSVSRAIRHALTYPAYRFYASTIPPTVGRTVFGSLRRRLGAFEQVRDLVRSDVLQRDWELGLTGSCVGLRKVTEDERATHWDAEF